MLGSVESVRARVGQELGASGWIAVDQAMINGFAEVTHDKNFIHVDPVAAGGTPFGGTIAHGLLVLSLLPIMAAEAGLLIDGTAMSVNYGFDKVRMVSPVRSGARVRGRFALKELSERTPGQWMMTLAVTVEIENEPKPAVVADWLTLQFIQ